MKTNINILSIDSGGVRNLISAYVLIRIEEAIQMMHNDPQVKIANIFDTFISVGSSTLLSSLYQIPDVNGMYRSAHEVSAQYEKLAAKIYNRKLSSYMRLTNTLCSQHRLNKGIHQLFFSKDEDINSKKNFVPLFNLSIGEIEIINTFFHDDTIQEIVKASMSTYPFFYPTKLNETLYCSGEHVSANPKFCLGDSKFKKVLSSYDVVNILSIGAGSSTKHSKANSINRIVKDCATQFFEDNFLPDQMINYFRIDVPTKKFNIINPLYNNSYINFSKKNIAAMQTAGQLSMGAIDKKELEKFIAFL
jgi:hypothetical protein